MHQPSRRRRHHRLLALMLPLGVFVTAAACGDNDAPIADPVEDVDDDVIGPDPSLVGLEITASGDVTDILAPIAFRIDKDGIGEEVEEAELGDEDFDDLDVVEEGVLVIDVQETELAEDAAVRVTGTVRRFELTEAERLFDVELDDDIYAPFDDELVIVADEVVREPAAAAGDSTTTSGG